MERLGTWAVVASMGACVACGGDDASGMGWDPADVGTSGGGSAGTIGGGTVADEDATTDPDLSGTEDPVDDSAGDSTGGAEVFDCAAVGDAVRGISLRQ